MSHKFEYQLQRNSRAKGLRLRISEDGQLKVSAPPLVPLFLIDNFVKKNEEWIQNALQKCQKLSNNYDQYMIFGLKYQVKFGYMENLKNGWQVLEKTLFYNNSAYLIQPKSMSELTSAEKEKLEKFARVTIAQYIQKRVPQIYTKMGLSQKLGKITIKNQSSRWGSCSSQGNLNFNFKLIHYETVVIDYILIHELSHLVHMNHGPNFWALVAKYDGNYKLHRRKLKQLA